MRSDGLVLIPRIPAPYTYINSHILISDGCNVSGSKSVAWLKDWLNADVGAHLGQDSGCYVSEFVMPVSRKGSLRAAEGMLH